MKRVIQAFRNMRMSAKLLISYSLIVAVAICGIGGLLYRFTDRQLRKQTDQLVSDAATLAADTLSERCLRLVRSLQHFTSDSNVIRIVNTTNYLSEYEKAYDVNQLLDPMIISVCGESSFIEDLTIYTYGEIGGVRIGYIKIRNNFENEWLTQSENAQWRYLDGRLGVCAGITNLWQPEHTATAVLGVRQELLFDGLLSELGDECMLTVAAADGTELFREEHISDADNWAKTEKTHRKATQTVAVNQWTVTVETASASMSGSVAETVREMLIVFAVVAVLMVLVSIAFSVSISSRVQKLRAQVRNLVDSNYQCDISSEDKDEIGTISNTIGEMVVQTREMITQTYQTELARKNETIRALQAQINPHFLYNTLSNLNWRALARDDIEMSRLLTDLSQFYRISLNGGNIESTVGRELEHIKTYVRIQNRIRGAELAEERYDVDENLLDYPMPGIILQPIVENAISHAIGAIGYENGRLCISVQLQQENISIRISDNGPGISQEVIDSVFDENGRTGYGLHNVYLRLQLVYGGRSSLRFLSDPNSGTTVEILLPPLSEETESARNI